MSLWHNNITIKWCKSLCAFLSRFQLSEEEYGKKGDTLRSFLQQNRLGKYNDEEMSKMKEQLQKELEEEAKWVIPGIKHSKSPYRALFVKCLPFIECVGRVDQTKMCSCQ